MLLSATSSAPKVPSRDRGDTCGEPAGDACGDRIRRRSRDTAAKRSAGASGALEPRGVTVPIDSASAYSSSFTSSWSSSFRSTLKSVLRRVLRPLLLLVWLITGLLLLLRASRSRLSEYSSASSSAVIDKK